MPYDPFRDVLDYHFAAAPHILRALPGVPEEGVYAYYGYGFIREEFNELLHAMLSGDVAGVADALGDLQYVVNRMAIIWGIDLRPVHEEIHRANLSKIEGGVVLRPDGKVEKGPHYRPPDVAGVLARQGSLLDPPADPGCPDCGGAGEYYWHSVDCRDELCALNGDYHSCEGEVIPCGCKASPSNPTT